MLIAVGLFSLMINGCEGPLVNNETELKLQLANSPKKIKIGFLKNSLSYKSQPKQKKIGLEYDLIEDFADNSGFTAEYFEFDSAIKLAEALEKHKLDIVALRGVLPGQNDKIILGPTYDETYLSIFCRKNDKVENLSDLSGAELLTLDSHLHRLRNNSQIEAIDNVQLKLFPNSDSYAVLSEIAWERADCAILEKIEGLYFSRFFMTLEEVATFEDGIPLKFYVNDELPHLNDLLEIWLQNSRRDNIISKYLDRYQSLAINIDEHDVKNFKNELKNTFPALKKYFMKASALSHISWKWLAAVAFQESNWDQSAVSSKGAVGIMQLTEETADRMGIADRHNLQENIIGGAEYLNLLYSQWPKNIPSQDRWALTLISYNMGLGHLKDAQALAILKSRNPYNWNDLQKVLPLLEDEKFYSQTRHGKARGRETVKFVNRVFAFQDLLVHQSN